MEDKILSPGNAAPVADIAANAAAQSDIRKPSVAVAMTTPAPDYVGMHNRAHRPMPPPLPGQDTMPPMPDARWEDIPPASSAPPDRAVSAPIEPEMSGCGYKKGELPPCAPLAAGFVPFQQENPPKYSAADALSKGTLFPGLDLPFMNVANKSNPYAGTPMGEVMALDFACHELTLYLDTHKDDTDAFEMLKSLLTLSEKGRREFEARFGPLDIRDLERADKFTWLDSPWPWEYSER